MKTLTDKNKIEFYKFLEREKSVEELENFIYSQTDIEKQLDKEIYLNLIEINFKDEYDKAKLLDLIMTKIIKQGEFETWKLKRVLKHFLSQPEKIDLNLEKIYDLYCGIYHENGKILYEYKFLGNLALNYLYWVEEGYLKTHFGENWKSEYAKCQNEFKFYYDQLKDFAIEIVFAIENKQIEILDNGTYKISDELKNKIESDKIYNLKHPNKN